VPEFEATSDIDLGLAEQQKSALCEAGKTT
jgi:hypothetical protein